MLQDFSWGSFISSIIAAMALAVSIWSIYYAYKASVLSSKANKISEETLGIYKKTFAEEQRPRLQLKPASKEGVVIHHYIKDNQLFFLIQIEMKNIGKTQAVEIICIRDLAKIIVSRKEYDFESSKAPQNAKSLSPGQDFICNRTVYISNDDSMRLKMLENQLLQSNLEILFDIALTYKGTLTEKVYNISAKYRLQMKVDYIVEYTAD